MGWLVLMDGGDVDRIGAQVRCPRVSDADAVLWHCERACECDGYDQVCFLSLVF